MSGPIPQGPRGGCLVSPKHKNAFVLASHANKARRSRGIQPGIWVSRNRSARVAGAKGAGSRIQGQSGDQVHRGEKPGVPPRPSAFSLQEKRVPEGTTKKVLCLSLSRGQHATVKTSNQAQALPGNYRLTMVSRCQPLAGGQAGSSSPPSSPRGWVLQLGPGPTLGGA